MSGATDRCLGLLGELSCVVPVPARLALYDSNVTEETPASTPVPDYPEEWETDIVLGDGSTAKIRPIRPGDRDLIDTFHKRQSQESIYFRFFRYRPELSDKELEYFTQIDYEQRMAFVATVGAELVAVARYETWDSPAHPDQKRAEVAFFVDDNHHGKGLATIMLEFLAAAGRQKGFDGFTATVLPENVGMLRVFRRAGFEVSTRFADGVIEVDLGIEVTEEATAAIAGRERRAQARSVARLLAPSSVAVVGASRDPASVGHELLRSIVDGAFAGPVYAVNVKAAGDVLCSVPVVASLTDVGEVDLVVVAVPADAVESVLDEAIAVKAAGLVVVSVGFSDAGEEGAERQRRLVDRARANGLRILGPNSFGLINTDPDVSLRALFVRAPVRSGSVGLLSQSGPLGASLLAEMSRADVGVSTMVAVGNRADVSVNDLVHYWTEDERTTAVALYLENFGNLRNFVPAVRRLSAVKPVIAVTPTEPELANVLRHCGVILVDQVADLVRQAGMVVNQPIPIGSRVAIVGNAASVGRLAAAACRKAGLDVVAPSSVGETTVADVVLVGDADTLALPREAEMLAYEQVLVAAAVSPEIDAIMVSIVPTPSLEVGELGELLARVNRAIDKPLVATGLIDPSELDVPGLPVFTFPEEAAMTLGRSAALGRWRMTDTDARIQAPDDWAEAARAVTVPLLGDAPGRELHLIDADMPGLLESLELSVAPYAIANSVEEAVAAAEELGYPVVLKAGQLAHRTAGEAGGAALDLRSGPAVGEAFERMLDSVGPERLLPAVVQRVVPVGRHLMVDLVQDPERGSRIELGVGGLAGLGVGALANVVLPTSESDLDRLLAEPWLVATVANDSARYQLRDVLSRLATVADACPDVARVSCNPVLVGGPAVSIVDVSITLAPWRRDPLAEVRHLE